MTAEQELAQYVGIPKCQDCGWKLYSGITDNCSCRGDMSPEREAKHKESFDRARHLQSLLILSVSL